MRKLRRTRKLRWRGSRGGIAGAVTAVLFVIIITTLLTGITLYYVPVWSKEAESEHMSRVADQFLSIQDGLNDMVKAEAVGSSLYFHIALTSGTTTSFLGIQGEPSQGTLGMDANASWIGIHDADNDTEIYTLAKGSLVFSSHNTQYTDQEHVYENGAAIVHQGGKSRIREGPRLVFGRDSWGCLTLSLDFVALFGETVQVTGAGSAGVEARLLHTQQVVMPFPIGKNVTVNGSTPHAQAWARWLNQSIQEQADEWSLTPANYSIAQSGSTFQVELKNLIQLSIRYSVMEMRVSR